MLAKSPEMSATAPEARFGAPGGTPRKVALGIAVGVALLLGGALYLILVRGEALVLDLGKLGQVFCF